MSKFQLIESLGLTIEYHRGISPARPYVRAADLEELLKKGTPTKLGILVRRPKPVRKCEHNSAYASIVSSGWKYCPVCGEHLRTAGAE